MILKIDTTDNKKTEVALLDKKGGLVNKSVEDRKYGSQTLIPQIIAILARTKKKFSDLSKIEVNPGPGSYTGVRVGVAVANALSWALKLPINSKKKGDLVNPKY